MQKDQAPEMQNEYPKRLFGDGNEPQVVKINNSCRMPLLARLKEALPLEYNKVKKDPVFAHVFAIHENNLGYSARLVHSIMCRQLVTKKKHELWFVFGGKPLRFSLQEFYAVTGFKYTDNGRCDYEKWKDDRGFWSKLLKRNGKICIKKLLADMTIVKQEWGEKDRIRLVYICVIAGLIMARCDTKNIDHLYIKMVMDLRNVRSYPWGLKAYDDLLNCVAKTSYDLKKTKSYVLDGFSYALQIWVMEAIPNIGSMLGEKINSELIGTPRCSNWKGAAKVSYEDIIFVESTFKSNGVVYPFLSYSGHNVIEAAKFVWPDEIQDGEVDNMIDKITSSNDFRDHVWGSVEDDDVEDNNLEDVQENVQVNDDEGEDDVIEDGSVIPNQSGDENHVSSLGKFKKKQRDHGAETRKKKLLCQRAATATHGALDEETKSFIKGLFDVSFSILENKIESRLDKFEEDLSVVKNFVSMSGSTRNTSRSTTLQPSIPTDQPSKSLDEMSLDDDVLGFGLDTQEFLQKSVGHLSQPSQESGFDPTQNLLRKKVHLRPIKLECEGKFIPDVGHNEKDADLVFVSDAKWDAFMEWQMKHQDLNFGPSVISKVLLGRILIASEWLGNEDMDATMYLFREKASLGQLKLARVGFMNCMFGMQLRNEYQKFAKNKRDHTWSTMLKAYAIGELPSHGKTRQKWRSDFDRIYFPLFVNNNHWISLCVNFILRTIEIFDCGGQHHRRNVEPFAITIPRIVKEIHTKSEVKNLLISPYTIIHVPVPPGLNKSRCDCGVYALKYIECHFMGMPIDMLGDANIKDARHRIAVDLWEAASDPVFIDRMAKYEPPLLDSDMVEID